MLKVETAFDKLETRCPQLGGPVHFGYCIKMDEGLPCSKSLICWELFFPVDRYMSGVLSKQEWEKVFNKQATPRLTKILEIATDIDPKSSKT